MKYYLKGKIMEINIIWDNIKKTSEFEDNTVEYIKNEG